MCYPHDLRGDGLLRAPARKRLTESTRVGHGTKALYPVKIFLPPIRYFYAKRICDRLWLQRLRRLPLSASCCYSWRNWDRGATLAFRDGGALLRPRIANHSNPAVRYAR